MDPEALKDFVVVNRRNDQGLWKSQVCTSRGWGPDAILAQAQSNASLGIRSHFGSSAKQYLLIWVQQGQEGAWGPKPFLAQAQNDTGPTDLRQVLVHPYPPWHPYPMQVLVLAPLP